LETKFGTGVRSLMLVTPCQRALYSPLRDTCWVNVAYYEGLAHFARAGGAGGQVDDYKGLIDLARAQGALGGLNRGACKKCGQLGHLTKQCRNQFSRFFDGGPDAATTAAAAAAAGAPLPSRAFSANSPDLHQPCGPFIAEWGHHLCSALFNPQVSEAALVSEYVRPR
jgi:hypothetical protein